MAIGSSPADTVHNNCAKVPSSKMSCPNEMGTILGGSEKFQKTKAIFVHLEL